MIKKLIACVLLFSLTLTGCSFDSENKNESEIKNYSIKSISFSWWGNDDRHSYTINSVDEFQKDNPGIVVKYRYSEWNGYQKRMNAMMMSNTAADVMQINYAWLFKYSKEGEGFLDLTNLKDDIDLSGYSKEDLSFGEVNGKLKGIPISLNTQTMYYNKTIFNKYGLEIPKTFDDLFNAAKVMKKDGIYPVGMVKKQAFFLVLSYYEQLTGKNIFSDVDKGKLDKEGLKKFLNLYKELLDKKVLMPIDNFDRTSFVSGKVAGTMAWVTDSQNYCNDLIENENDVVVGEYPKTNNSNNSEWYIKPSTLYSISANTNNVNDAVKLLNYLINDKRMIKSQGIEKGIPLNKNAEKILKDENMLDGITMSAYNLMIKNRSDMKIMSPCMEDDDILSAIKSGVDKYVYGNKSLDESISSIHEAVPKIDF